MAPIDGRRATGRPFRSSVTCRRKAILGSSCPGGPTRRRGSESPARTGTGEATGASEVGRIGRAGNNTSRPSEAPHKGECGTPKRRHEGDVITLLPRSSGGSQNPSHRLGRKPKGPHREPASTGARSRVSLGSRHRSDASKVLVRRSVARRYVAPVPSPKEAATS